VNRIGSLARSQQKGEGGGDKKNERSEDHSATLGLRESGTSGVQKRGWRILRHIGHLISLKKEKMSLGGDEAGVKKKKKKKKKDGGKTKD